MNRHFVTAIAITITLLAYTQAAVAQSCPPHSNNPLIRTSADIKLNFDKSLSGFGTWEGTVNGDVTGKLKTYMQKLDISGEIARVEFDFVIDAGASSFTTRLIGLLNPKTGKVMMDGFVSDGQYAGLRVEENGQLVDPATFRFQGTIVLKRPCN